jgi:hypothetical protein
MRTTITLDPDTEALIKDLMQREGVGFKEAVNRAIRQGLGSSTRRRFRQRTVDMGWRAEVDVDKALLLAGRLEDDALLRKLAEGR